MSPMQLTSGTVVNGKIVLEGIALPEGATVAVLTAGSDGAFSLSPDQQRELIEANAAMDRGESVSLEELLASLDPSHE